MVAEFGAIALHPYVVGLVAYGHRARIKRNDYYKTEVNPDWRFPIPPNVADNWQNDFELLTPPSRLVVSHYQQLVQSVGILQPFGQTPLLGATTFAANELVERRRGGVVVAITDGVYNDDKRRLQPLEELFQKHPELSLHVVAFNVEEKKELVTLADMVKRTQGKFYEALTGADLAQTIGTVMKPRQYSLVRDGEPQEEIFADLGATIGGRPRGHYEVRFPGMASIPVRIQGGERLTFDLDSGGGRLVHERPQLRWFRRIENASDVSRSEPTRLGYLRAEYDKGKRAAILEVAMDREDQLCMVDRPAEIRFRVNARGETRPASFAWTLAPDRSIPAWQIELGNWPVHRSPEIQATWKMNRTDPDLQLSLAELLPEARKIELPGWPEHGLTVTAERQQGKVLIRVQADGGAPPELDVGDIRVELGQLSTAERQFVPEAIRWRSRLFKAQRQLEYEFDTDQNLDLDRLLLGFTSAKSLSQGARRLERPLVIEKCSAPAFSFGC